MAAGASATITVQQIHGLAGTLAKEIENVFDRVREFNTYLVATNLQTSFGLGPQDDADIKSAFANMLELIAVYEGRNSVGTAHQSRVFILRLVGPGAHL